MSAVDFEYAIRTDVRNNPIVREVDEARQRQLWNTAAIFGVLAVVVLFSVWQNAELVWHGYAMQELQQQRAEEEEINRRLRLELETLKSPARIERVATTTLGLEAPGGDDAIVIERVTPPAPPAKSIVAVR
jgi:cell division protein FtsL